MLSLLAGSGGSTMPKAYGMGSAWEKIFKGNTEEEIVLIYTKSCALEVVNILSKLYSSCMYMCCLST